MKLKKTKNKLESYLKKVGISKEDYAEKENVSTFIFFGDREDLGENQIIHQTGYTYDREMLNDTLEDFCEKINREGFKNIRIEAYKKYYKKLKSCPVQALMSKLVWEFKYI